MVGVGVEADVMSGTVIWEPDTPSQVNHAKAGTSTSKSSSSSSLKVWLLVENVVDFCTMAPLVFTLQFVLPRVVQPPLSEPAFSVSV